MLIYIEVFIFYNLIIENFHEYNLNNFFFKMNTKIKHDKMELFERENK